MVYLIITLDGINLGYLGPFLYAGVINSALSKINLKLIFDFHHFAGFFFTTTELSIGNVKAHSRSLVFMTLNLSLLKLFFFLILDQSSLHITVVWIWILTHTKMHQYQLIMVVYFLISLLFTLDCFMANYNLLLKVCNMLDNWNHTKNNLWFSITKSWQYA